MLHGWTLKDRVMDEVSEGTQADMLLGLVMGFVFGTLPTHLTPQPTSPTHQLTNSPAHYSALTRVPLHHSAYATRRMRLRARLGHASHGTRHDAPHLVCSASFSLVRLSHAETASPLSCSRLTSLLMFLVL